MKGVVTTLAVAAATAAAYFGLSYGVQAAGLRSASHASRVGANVAAVLLRHRLVSSDFTVDGKQHWRASCLHHWFPRANGKLGRGSLLAFADGGLVLENGGPIRTVNTPPQNYLARLRLYLGGCSWDLGQRVAVAAQLDQVRLSNATLAGRRVLKLKLIRLHDEAAKGFVVDHVTLWVDPRTYQPVRVWAKVGRHEGSGRIRIEPATPARVGRLVRMAAAAS
jgi:hypothetical protein